MQSIITFTRYKGFPSFAVFILPVLVTTLLYFVSPQKKLDFSYSGQSLSYILGYGLYAFVTLYPYIPQLQTEGPLQVEGTVPLYNRNGFQFYLATVAIQLMLTYLYGNGVFLFLMDNHILSSILLTFIGYIFTVYLYFQGKQRHAALRRNDKLPKALEEPANTTTIYQYYRGMDFHPRFFGVDVKQLTNCRFGMMIWQILVLGWGLASTERFGLNYGVLATTVLQSLYIAKFFYWEMGYFYTLDMILDRGGFYICWGCIVFVPCFYTLASFIIASNPPQISLFYSLVCIVLGIFSLIFNYWVDYQKQYFQQCNKSGKKCLIWGQEAQFLKVKYERKGQMVDSKLLISGFWGMTRHMNYTFELLVSFFWCFVGVQSSIFALSYFGFLFLLLVTRIYRDEEKCSKKYGKYWVEYCEKVKYRLIPYLY